MKHGTNGETNAGTNGVRNASRTATGTPTPTRPDPTRPDPILFLRLYAPHDPETWGLSSCRGASRLAPEKHAVQTPPNPEERNPMNQPQTTRAGGRA